MANTLLVRPDEQVFASAANTGEVRAFPDIPRGWGLTFDNPDDGGNGGFPPMEWFNALLARIDSATNYFLQRGVAEWRATTLYAIGSVVSLDALLFRSTRAHTNVRPGSDATTWIQLADAATALQLAPPGLFGLFITPTPPAGWLRMNGAALSRLTYANLYAAIGTMYGAPDSSTFAIPDVRGEFIRCLDDGRGVDPGRGIGNWQGDAFRSHWHGGTALFVGDHIHGASAWTDVQGWHGHAVVDNGHLHPLGFGVISDQPGGGPPYAATGGNPSAYRYQTAPATANIGIAGEGNHAHNVGVSIGAGGGHQHAIQTDWQGGTETRPRNIAFLACIKY
jgi:phage-related tail fiber protein